MAGYHERLRDLENTRWLMRDFLIYGFRTRNDQRMSSPRTYDNERHRIEGLLGDMLQWRQNEGGRQYFISAEAAALDANPLQKIYRLRTFTDNDMMLHCSILALMDAEEAVDVASLTDRIGSETDFYPDVLTVRRKLQEYTALGIVREEKDGKRATYILSDRKWEKLFPDDTGLEECLSFFREALPMGSLADGFMLRRGFENRFIRFKHHFLMHTLDDDVLLTLLEAMHDGAAVAITFEGKSKDGSDGHQTRILPVCVRVSEETGRRYLIGYDMKHEKPRSVRLDIIRTIERTDPPQNAAACVEEVRKELSHCWGISMNNKPSVYHVEMDVRIDLPKEEFVLDRLQREGRGGRVTRIDWDMFRYEIDVEDPMEMMRWVRTFTGRIAAIRDESGQIDRRFREDMERMRALYGEEAKRDGTV